MTGDRGWLVLECQRGGDPTHLIVDLWGCVLLAFEPLTWAGGKPIAEIALSLESLGWRFTGPVPYRSPVPRRQRDTDRRYDLVRQMTVASDPR